MVKLTKFSVEVDSWELFFVVYDVGSGWNLLNSFLLSGDFRVYRSGLEILAIIIIK